MLLLLLLLLLRLLQQASLKPRWLWSRGPAAILFVLRDTCSYSIANYFVLVFRGITRLSCDVLQNGVSYRCSSVKLTPNRGFANQKGGLGRCSPLPKTSSKKCFPAVLPWQKKAMIFIPGSQKKERGHIRQNRPLTKPPFCFLSN